MWKRKTNPRKSISKIVAGKEVTEEVLDKMKDIESRMKESKRKQQKKSQSNDKTKKMKTKVVEPQPGPSCINLVPDSPSIDSDSDDEQSLCCVCKKFTPAELSESVSLVFAKSAQCDGIKNGLTCLHWVHLIYCSPVRVIRKGDKFLRPCCEKEE